MESKFDLIIANPPFAMGNKIIANAVNCAKECVVLMPALLYRAGSLSQHVDDAFLVDPKAFKDAVISPSLSVCHLTPAVSPGTFDDFYTRYIVDKDFVEFFRLNNLLPMPEVVTLYGASHVDDLNLDDYFFFSYRFSNDGVPTDLENSQCAMKRFNILKDYSALYHDNGRCIMGFLVHIGQKGCENLSKFVFRNPLVNEILVAIKDNCANVKKYFPRIDWSVDRDYEHLTLNQLLEIMREEVKNPRKMSYITPRKTPYKACSDKYNLF